MSEQTLSQVDQRRSLVVQFNQFAMGKGNRAQLVKACERLTIWRVDHEGEDFFVWCQTAEDAARLVLAEVGTRIDGDDPVPAVKRLTTEQNVQLVLGAGDYGEQHVSVAILLDDRLEGVLSSSLSL